MRIRVAASRSAGHWCTWDDSGGPSPDCGARRLRRDYPLARASRGRPTSQTISSLQTILSTGLYSLPASCTAGWGPGTHFWSPSFSGFAYPCLPPAAEYRSGARQRIVLRPSGANLCTRWLAGAVARYLAAYVPALKELTYVLIEPLALLLGHPVSAMSLHPTSNSASKKDAAHSRLASLPGQATDAPVSLSTVALSACCQLAGLRD
jgi:hypothetical protein